MSRQIEPILIYENELIEDKKINEKLNSILERYPKAEDFIKKQGKNFKIKNYVGLLEIENYEIDILPKIWKKNKGNDEDSKRNFLYLFSYAFFRPKFFEPYLNILNEKNKYTLKDFFVMLFSETLFDNLKKGLYKNYVKKDEESNYIHGKLILKEQIKKIDESKFSVRTYEFTADNKLNQFFNWCTEYFTLGLENTSIRKTLFRNGIILKSENIQTLRSPEFDVSFNRMNERFEIPYNYAKMVLGNRFMKSGGNRRVMMFLYDMNKIFEQFLYNFICEYQKEIFGGNDPKIDFQQSKFNFIIPKGSNRAELETKPDILITVNGKTIIVDAKNKINDEPGFKGLDIQDLYQMHTYSNLYEGDAVLYYPTADISHEQISGPYKYHKDSKYNLWISKLNLDFSGDWKNRLKGYLKEDFEEIIKNYNNSSLI